MTFQNTLKEYMETLNCSIRELSNVSGISQSAFSRYLSGQRQPVKNSDQIDRLASGIAELASGRGRSDLTKTNICAELLESLTGSNSRERFSEKLNLLIQTLNINVSQMAGFTGYDTSTVYKIRNGYRYPADDKMFVNRITHYVTSTYSAKRLQPLLSELIGCPPEELSSPEAIKQMLGNWLISGNLLVDNSPMYTSQFLHKLDDFNLEDYIRAIHFSAPEPPSEAFPETAEEIFRGTEGRKNAELLFLKYAALSDSKEPVFLFSDMEMSDVAADMDFSKKWMLLLAAILKKAQPLCIIHYLDRPLHELMLGLEAYIPLYMTGLVAPYYLKGAHNMVFRHYLDVSENYALSGESVVGAQEQARFYLTSRPDEVAYYRERANSLLEKASPLMSIYTIENRMQYLQFWKGSSIEKADRHFISSALPVFSMPSERLSEILAESDMPKELQEVFIADAQKQREYMEQLLLTCSVFDELPLVDREEYDRQPLPLSLSNSFTPPLKYSYDCYLEHLEYTKQYAKAHPSYRIQLRSDFAFRNIRIHIAKGKWVWISKIASPMIHFVIHQPQLRKAIENMYTAVTD